MIKLNDDLLRELGLDSLPLEEKKRMLAHIYETLEMRVGMKLAQQMTDQQLDEFEQFIKSNDEAGALHWLETKFPHYKDVVAAEFENLKAEIRQVAPQILASAQQAAAMQPQSSIPMSPMGQPQLSQPSQPAFGQPQPFQPPAPQMQPQWGQHQQPTHQWPSPPTQQPQFGGPQSAYGYGGQQPQQSFGSATPRVNAAQAQAPAPLPAQNQYAYGGPAAPSAAAAVPPPSSQPQQHTAGMGAAPVDPWPAPGQQQQPPLAA